MHRTPAQTGHFGRSWHELKQTEPCFAAPVPFILAPSPRLSLCGAKGVMKIKVDTSKLALVGPGASGGWESAPAVRRREKLDAVREMRALGLVQIELRRLMRRLANAASARTITDNWPTVGEDRAVLLAAADLSQALAEILLGASPRGQAELAMAALEAVRDTDFPDRASRELRAFAGALHARVAKMPKQSRPHSFTEIIRALIEIAGHRLGSPTTWPESKFRRACVAAFVLAGTPGSPDRAIRAVYGTP